MDHDFINDFIEEYKNQPCLWQASSSDFKDRKKRQEAYYKLIEVASKHGEHYNIERTKQKINNLRCAFRHQLKKINESKNSKSGKDEGYCPKRRYIESLMFLLNEEQTESAKVDNLKTVPVTKRKSNNNNNNNNNNISSSNCNESPSKTKKTGAIRNDKQSQIYCETIVIPNESSTINTSNISNDESLKKDKIKHHQRHHHQQQQQQQQQQQHQQQQQQVQQSQQSEIIIKSIEDIPTETTTTIKETIQQHSPVQIEVHCDDDVNLLWQRSNITQQKCNEPTTSIVPITSNPVTISTVPVATAVSIIPATIPTSSIPSITTTNANTTILETINTHHPIRQRTMSTSSQNSSHSIVENATKKVKIDCSTINFDKLLSLACSKINTIIDVDDDYSVFGKMVSYKLRSMEPQQAIIAEKMITDILLEGQMKMLTYPIRTVTTTTTATATTIPTFRRGDEAQALVINLNGNATTSADHHHHSFHHHQQHQDTTKYSSQNI